MISRSSIGKGIIRVLKRRNILAACLMWIILASSILLVIVNNNFASGNPIPGEGPYIRITVDSENRTRYGFVYPLTYVFSIPDDASSLKVWLRYDVSEDWVQLPEKTSDDFFNGIYAVRFNYTNDKAYVSVGFNGTGNSIHLRFTDSSDNGIYDVSYLGISQYYDNRKCVVTVTVDDWDAEKSSYFIRAINLFQEREMWVTPGIVTNGIAFLGESFNATTWMEVQNEVNEGYVEPASHSRTHPHPPYSNVTWEVQGSRDDIIGNLTSIPYSWGSNKYVYMWMEPFGEWDDAIRAEIGQSDYIVDREYYYTSDVSWGDYNSSLGIYTASHYPDPGGRWDDTGAIDSRFGNAYDSGEIYHGMFHPADLSEEEWQNVTDHLDYISGRKDVWYVGFGHLYMYHYLQEFSSQLLSVETIGFITDTTDSDFQQGTLENTEIINGSLRLTTLTDGTPASFGKTDVGTNTVNIGHRTVVATKFTVGSAGSITEVSVFLSAGSQGSGNRILIVGLYDDNGGNPNNLLTSGSTIVWLITTPQWYNLAVTPYELGTGTYHLAWQTDIRDSRAYYDTGTSGQTKLRYGQSSLPNPFGAPDTSQNNEYSIYANYTGTSSGGNGTWTSKWHDAGKIVDWTTISWSEITLPGTDILISTRTAPEMFKGIPDESNASPWSANLTDPAGSVIASPDNRFLQYRVYLLTDGSNSPILNAATVFYENSSLPQPAYATLTVDSTPVKGECFVNSTSLGITPQTVSVVPGTYEVSWEDIVGYYTPTSQIVTLTDNEIDTVVGVYEEPPPPPPQYKLSINSQPINGFTVEVSNSTDTFQINTGTSIVLTEGDYTVTIIDTSIEITFEQWTFDSWSDGNTSASRTITLSKDTILLYEYVRP